MDIELLILKSVNVYNSAGDWIGRAEEMILPQEERSLRTYSGLGLAGSFDVPGPLKQPSAIFIWGSHSSVAFLSAQLQVGAATFICRCALQDCVSGAPELPVICKMTGTFASSADHSNRVRLDLQYYNLRVGEREIELYDFFSNIWRKRGKNIMPG